MTMITKKSIRDSFRPTKQAKQAEIAALQEQIAAARAELNAIRAEEKAQLATVPTKTKSAKAPSATVSKLHPFADLLVIPAIGTHMAAASAPAIVSMPEPKYVTTNKKVNAALYLHQLANSHEPHHLAWAEAHADDADLSQEDATFAKDWWATNNTGIARVFTPWGLRELTDVDHRATVARTRKDMKDTADNLSRWGTEEAAYVVPAEQAFLDAAGVEWVGSHDVRYIDGTVVAANLEHCKAEWVKKIPVTTPDHVMKELQFWADLHPARRTIDFGDGCGVDWNRTSHLHELMAGMKMTKKQAMQYLEFCKRDLPDDSDDSGSAACERRDFIERQNVVIKVLLSPKKEASTSVVEEVDTAQLEAEVKYQADVAALALD